MKHRKKSTTRKHKKCCRGGMQNEQLPLDPISEDCPICLEPMGTDNNTVFTNLFRCRHIFHKVCIIMMIDSKRNVGNDVFGIVCPMCRATLSDPQGTGTVDAVNRILDIDDVETKMSMFNDMLQYSYDYRQNAFQLYIVPIARSRIVNFITSNIGTTLGSGLYYFLSLTITGSNARELLNNVYSNVLVFQIMRIIYSLTSIVRGENRLENVLSVGVFYMSFCFNNILIQENTRHNLVFDINDALRYISEIFESFLVEDSEFFQYFNHLNDNNNNREPYGRFGGSAQVMNSNVNSSNKTLKFKFTSMEDVKKFLDIANKNKTKLGSLLDKLPFTLSVFFPEVEYSRELVQKLRPLLTGKKNRYKSKK